MRLLIRSLLIATTTALLASCVSSRATVDQAIIRNASDRTVTKVAVIHLETNAVGRVNRLLPGTDFDLRFSAQTVRAQRAEVSWTDASGRAWVVELDVPRNDGRSGPLTLIYTLESDGRATVHLEWGEQR